MNPRRVLLAIILIPSTLGLVSCKKKAPPQTTNVARPAINTAATGDFGSDRWLQRKEANEQNVSAAQGGTFAHVTYKPEVKTIDQSAVDSSLIDISTDGHGAVFQNASPEIRALKAGDIFMIKNAFAAKVLDAGTDGNETAILFDRARLVDVIQDGEINIDSPVSFHGPRVVAMQREASHPFHLMDLIDTPVYAQTDHTTPVDTGISTDKPANLDGNNGTHANALPTPVAAAQAALASGWKLVSWSVTPGDNTAAMNVAMTKDTDGFKAAIQVDGNITNFQFVSDLKFHGIGTQVVQGVKGMTGHMHFVWEIGKETPGVWAKEEKIKLPGALTIPLNQFVDGLPLTLSISSAFLIHPALTGGNEYSRGGFSIDWIGSDSTAGQAISQGEASGTEGLVFKITDDANISPVAPNGMVLSVCIPRIELNLGLKLTSNKTAAKFAGYADKIITKLESKLPADILKKLQASPLGKMSVSGVLSSSADLYDQIIHTEGVTHSANISLASCTKTELKITGQFGGEATLLGIKMGGPTTFNPQVIRNNPEDLFTKTYTEWKPGSSFCKSL